MNDPNLISTPPSISINDVLYTIFKHKWKIIAGLVIGLCAGAATYKLYPKSFSSQTRLFIRYVEQGQTPTTDKGTHRITTMESRGEQIINSELQIITSMDLAFKIADKIGPDRILQNPSMKYARDDAAKKIRDALRVSVPNSSMVITVEFTHSDPQLVQPVLSELIDAYLAKHLETRSAGSFESFVNQQAEQYRNRLARTEEELRDALDRAGVISLDAAKADQNVKLASIQGALFDSNAELASRQAALDEMRKLVPRALETTNNADVLAEENIDPIKLETYASIQAQLDLLHRNEQQLLTRYTTGNPLVASVQSQIEKFESRKADLEKQNPGLIRTEVKISGNKNNVTLTINDINSMLIQVISLQSKINVLESQYAKIQERAERISSVETEIRDLNRRKEIEENNFRYFSTSREQAKIDEAFGGGRVNNIGIVQNPSPPDFDTKKTLKLAGGVALGFVALGLAWAFLLELFIDQTIKRPVDLKRILDLPLFLSIPDTNSRSYRKLLAKTGKQDALRRLKRSKGKANKEQYSPSSPTLIAAAKTDPDQFGPVGNAASEDHSSASPWDNDHTLHSYFEALRDRLIGFFEGRNLTHKPKLIGLTGLGQHPGTTTIASGLAATLSETGEGNVLIVDMTLGHESAQQFYRGKAIESLDHLLDNPSNSTGNSGSLTVAAEGSNGYKLPKILPNRFNLLVPKLKASNYDYIIFDMPPVSPISVTPRLASFMDAMFLVIESEKASKDVVLRAAELLEKTNQNIGTILNKTKNYVPQRLQEEYLGDL